METGNIDFTKVGALCGKRSLIINGLVSFAALCSNLQT